MIYKVCYLSTVSRLFRLLPGLLFCCLLWSQLLPAAEPLLNPKEDKLLQKAATLETAAAAAEFLRQETAAAAGAAFFFSRSVYEFQAGQLTLARHSLEEALRLAPDFSRAKLNLAQLHLQAEQYPEANRRLWQLIETQTENSEQVWFLLAQSYLRQQQYLAAESAARQVLLRQPERLDCQLLLCQCLLMLNRWPEAAALAASVLQKNPQQPQLWNIRVQTALQSEQTDEAISLLETARQLGAIDPPAQLILVQLLVQKQLYEPAAELLLKTIQYPQVNWEKVFSLTERLLPEKPAAGDVDALFKEMKILLPHLSDELQEKWTELEARRAMLNGKPEQAELLWKQQLSQNPWNGQALLALAAIYKNADNFAEAEHYLRLAEVLPEFRWQACFEMAALQAEQRNYQVALDYTIKAQQIKNRPELEEFARQLRSWLE